MLLTRRTRRNAEFCRGSAARPSREYGWPRYSSAAGAVIAKVWWGESLLTVGQIGMSREALGRTIDPSGPIPDPDSDALALEKVTRDAPEAVAEYAR